MSAFSRQTTPGPSAASDPLAVLGALPGVAEAVDSARQAVDRVYGHRVMRRRSERGHLRGRAARSAWVRGAVGGGLVAGGGAPAQ